MGGAVRGPEFIGHIGDRPGEDIDILRQGGGREGESKAYAGAFEGVNGARGQHIQPGLAKCGGRSRFRPHDAEVVAINGNEALQPVGLAGPVGRIPVRQVVGGGPDAEVGVAGHERHGRGAESLCLD